MGPGAKATSHVITLWHQFASGSLETQRVHSARMADGAAPHTREASGSPARASNVDERLKDMPEELNEEGREKDRSDYINDKCDLKHALWELVLAISKKSAFCLV